MPRSKTEAFQQQSKNIQHASGTALHRGALASRSASVTHSTPGRRRIAVRFSRNPKIRRDFIVALFGNSALCPFQPTPSGGQWSVQSRTRRDHLPIFPFYPPPREHPGAAQNVALSRGRGRTIELMPRMQCAARSLF